jgi:DNA helicase-2/ATP-dependent DNA helicase PcrA
MALDFTDEQQRIFNFVQNETGHGIIDAVAGAGKTTTIIECAKFVGTNRPILFCAFNNSISSEIFGKFRQLAMHNVTVKTIHALGKQILQMNIGSKNKITLTENKYNELIKNDEIRERLKPFIEKILEINNLDPLNTLDKKQKFAIDNAIFRINKRLIDINQKFRATLTNEEIISFEEMVFHFGIFNEFEARKKQFKEELNCYYDCHKILLAAGNHFSEKTMNIDYTDMLYLPFKWDLKPTIEYDFLFIDECQDLSKSQFEIVIKYGKKGGRIIAVGDPQQSIYGFTGADIDSFSRVKEYTNATELPLTTSFRCPQRAIELARTIRKDIRGIKNELGTITEIALDDVVNLSSEGDIIISRLRAPLILLAFSFIDKDIRVSIHPDDIKEIIREMKKMFKPEELSVKISSLNSEFISLKNEVSARWKWIFTNNSERIVDEIERSLYVETEMNYLEAKLDFLSRRYEKWKDVCPTLDDIIRNVKEFISINKSAIKLSTIHRSKGLENDRVFILNYDELPYERLVQNEWQKIQELNLKYVAITRVKSELFLITSKNQE